MKKLSILFALSTTLLFGEVENVTSGNEFLFSNESSGTFFIENEEKGLSLDEFNIPKTQSIRTSSGNENSFSLGMMMNMNKLTYLGIDASFDLLPLIDIKYNNFFIRPSVVETTKSYEAGYTFYSDTQFLVNALIEYHMAGYDASKLDYPYSKYLDDKNSEFYLGVSAKFIPESSPEFELSADITQNLTDSEGMRIKFYAQRYIQYTQDLFIIPGVSYVFLNDKYVKNYYGITSEEADNLGISSYSPSSGNKFGAHIDISYNISPNLKFRSINAIEFLSNDIVSSPVVENSSNISLGIGLMFTF